MAIALRVGAKSDQGLVRSENQDRMTRFVCRFGEVFLVADGMGGHQGGATAAAMVVQGFEKYLRETTAETYAEALQEATRRTNQEVCALGSSGQPEYAGMGSTVVLALFQGGQVIVGHVGDSRAYLVHDGHLERLTTDHTAVQRMVSAGMLSEAEAREHPDASVLSRVIGQTREVEMDILPPRSFGHGDGILLCSDGLSGYVDDAQIAEALVSARNDPPAVVEALIGLAMAAGGEDNVTVQYIRPETGRTHFAIPAMEPRKLARSRAVWIGIAMAALASAAAFVWVRAQLETLKAPPQTPPQKLIVVESGGSASPPPTTPPPKPPQSPDPTSTPPAPTPAAGTPPTGQGTPPTPPPAPVPPRVVFLTGRANPDASVVDEKRRKLTADAWKTKILFVPQRARQSQNSLVRDDTAVFYNGDQDQALAGEIAAEIGAGPARPFDGAARGHFPTARVLVVVGKKK